MPQLTPQESSQFMHARKKVDVVVVGAGTAGAGVAHQCASRGMRVVVLERRSLRQAGARWVNGVALHHLDAAGIPRPEDDDDELVTAPENFHLVAGWGPERVVVKDHGVSDLDMRYLVSRLQNLARSAGAEILEEVEVRGFDGHRLATNRGEFSAGLFVDASGLKGARLMKTPPLAHSHICAAAQGVHAITDLSAAREFFARHEVGEGEVLCFSGVAGGYSIVNVRLHGDELAILTGSVPGDGHPSGRMLLEQFVAEHAWVGKSRFGGARAIPIRRPYDRLAQGRVALVGDSASQVFPAHGSGIGQGLMAGKILAETLAEGGSPRDYAVRWQRKHGALLAAYDVFRRFSQTLSSDEVRGLITAGLMDASTTGAGMAQRWPRLEPADARKKVLRAGGQPRLAARIGGVLARMGAVAALYKAYPNSKKRRLKAWSRAVAAVFGEPPDIR
jgi:flavin-dependent dehydrogenase